MSKFAKHIPSNPHGKQQITAKGPQDCVPMNPQQFASCSIYVAKAFMSAAVVPEQFFAVVPAGSSLSEDAQRRTLLASFAHFKQNQNLALSFFYRYKALLQLHASNDLSRWITQAEGSEYAVFSIDILSVAARRSMLPNGTFEATGFIHDLEELSSVRQAQQNAAAETKIEQPVPAHSSPTHNTVVAQERLAA